MMCSNALLDAMARWLGKFALNKPDALTFQYPGQEVVFQRTLCGERESKSKIEDTHKEVRAKPTATMQNGVGCQGQPLTHR